MERAILDMKKLLGFIPKSVVAPDISASVDEDEAQVSWDSIAAGVFILFEGDGSYGYGLKRGDKFYPGDTEVKSICGLPQDLNDYLIANFTK